MREAYCQSVTPAKAMKQYTANARSLLPIRHSRESDEAIHCKCEKPIANPSFPRKRESIFNAIISPKRLYSRNLQRSFISSRVNVRPPVSMSSRNS